MTQKQNLYHNKGCCRFQSACLDLKCSTMERAHHPGSYNSFLGDWYEGVNAESEISMLDRFSQIVLR